jgi:WD40 repeat protein
VAAAEADGLVRVWDVTAGRAVTFLKAGGPVSFSPDGRRLATGAADGPEILLWELPDGGAKGK